MQSQSVQIGAVTVPYRGSLLVVGGQFADTGYYNSDIYFLGDNHEWTTLGVRLHYGRVGHAAGVAGGIFQCNGCCV